MSPEQAVGDLDRLGRASDVYSLGATLYCLLTGKPPFEGHDLAIVLENVRRGEFPRPRQVNRIIDPALEAICLKAMALRPEDRYPTPARWPRTSIAGSPTSRSAPGASRGRSGRGGGPDGTAIRSRSHSCSSSSWPWSSWPLGGT